MLNKMLANRAKRRKPLDNRETAKQKERLLHFWNRMAVGRGCCSKRASHLPRLENRTFAECGGQKHPGNTRGSSRGRYPAYRDVDRNLVDHRKSSSWKYRRFLLEAMDGLPDNKKGSHILVRVLGSDLAYDEYEPGKCRGLVDPRIQPSRGRGFPKSGRKQRAILFPAPDPKPPVTSLVEYSEPVPRLAANEKRV